MADIKSVVITAGKSLLTNALAGLELFRPTRFQIGDSFGFQPLASDSAITGTLVYTGSQSLIQRKQVAPDTARYILTVPEGAGPFAIGNLMLYAADVEGDTEVPFISVALPFAYQKTVSDPNLGSSLNSAIPVPGNRFVCNINIKHSLDAVSISVDVVTPTFSSLGFYENVSEIPPPLLNPWKVFVAHDDPRSNTPTLVAERNDGSYWATPMWQSFRDPRFGTISGGVAGDNYKPYPSNYAWGYKYETPLTYFKGSLGGSGYDGVDADYTDSVGGSAY